MESTKDNIIDAALVKKIIRQRDPFSHKGDYGYAGLIAGSYGMMGAAVLAATSCLRSGAGKLTCCIPEIGYDIIQTSVPEAMVRVCGKKIIKNVEDLNAFTGLGIGPGIGKRKSHAALLEKIFGKYKKPVVLDADALNVIAENKDLLKKIPAESILTPHPKEFERLFGTTEKEFERTLLALEMSHEYKVFIILKGHRSLITTPDRKSYINSTGNPGMATAGSGDVLTGIITGFMAQGYSSLESCQAGVYIHGLAGDIAAGLLSQNAMIAGDINRHLGDAFKTLA
jgi:NAD(P)H-hydrate epimerase